MHQRLVTDGMKIPACLYAPVGLKIGGNSPAEIAVSVAAEVVATVHGSPVTHMRLSTLRSITVDR